MKNLFHEIFFRIVLFIIFPASLLVLSELLYRSYYFVAEKKSPVILTGQKVLELSWYNPHPHLIYTRKPNIKEFIKTSYGGFSLSTNSFGFRTTREFDVKSKNKDKKTLRVVTFGGSTTQGTNDDDQVWPYQLGKKLTKIFPRKKN